MANDLTLISDASRMLAEARELPDILKVANIAQRARDYAKAAKLGIEAQNYASAICREAEAKAGALLVEMAETGERMTPQVARLSTPSGGRRPPTLEELGIGGKDSTRWRAVARVPAETRQAYYADANASQQTITREGLIRYASPVVDDIEDDEPEDDEPEEPTPPKRRERVDPEIARLVRERLPNYPPVQLMPKLLAYGHDLARYKPALTAERLRDEDVPKLQAIRDYIGRVLVARQQIEEEVAP